MKAICQDDSVTTCDCCGKSGLKFTILMSNGSHYGSVCATYHSGKKSSVLRREIADEDARRVAAARDDLEVHPATDALAVKILQRPRAMVGKPALEFIAAEREAFEIARREIAAAHGVPVDRVY